MNPPHIQWAIKTLNDAGYNIENAKPEKIQDTVWSQVCRFKTEQGLIYLKKVPAALVPCKIPSPSRVALSDPDIFLNRTLI
jgi:hypothetical protein